MDLLEEVGYASLSIEAVSARAGVGKPTVYRWWKNKAHLAYAASCSGAAERNMPATGTFSVDLRTFVLRVADFYWREGVTAALRGMLADPEVSQAIQADWVGPARAYVRRLVEGGRTSGIVRRDADPDALFDLAVGALMLRALGPPLDAAARAQATDAVIESLLRGFLAPDQNGPLRSDSGGPTANH